MLPAERGKQVTSSLPNQPGTISLSPVATTGTISVTTRSTTGYVKGVFWDNTSTIYGTGNPSALVSVTKSLVGSPAGKKPLVIESTNAIGGKSGQLTWVQLPSNSGEADIRSINSPISMLSTVLATSNVLLPETLSATTVQVFNTDVFRMDAIAFETLDAIGSTSTEINLGTQTNVLAVQVTSAAAVTSINVLGVKFRSGGLISIVNAGMLTTCLCKANNAEQITITACPNLQTLDMTGCSSAQTITVSYNGLTSLNVKGCMPTGGVYGKKKTTAALDVRFNMLSASALNDVFTDLDPVTNPVNVPIVWVAYNPGAATCDPTIATAKGYVVLTA